MQKLEEIVNLEIPAGSQAGSVRFTPQPGQVVACAIYTNGAANTGFVTAKISTDSGETITPATDIRSYRDREAGYIEGKKPVDFDPCNRTLVFEVFATEYYAAAFKAQLVLIYERKL